MDTEEDKKNAIEALGMSSYSDATMAVRQKENLGGMQDTVLHEIVHMIQKQYGIRYLRQSPSTDENEEAFTVLWTQAILSLIKDNPALMDYLRQS